MDIITELVSKVVTELGGRLIAPIGRQFGYVFCYKKFVQNLDKEVKELEIRKKLVQGDVIKAENADYLIREFATDWLRKVDIKAEEAASLKKAVEAANLTGHSVKDGNLTGRSVKDTCFHGRLPNPMVRHQNGRKFYKMTEDIMELHREGKTCKFQQIAYERTPIAIVTGSPPDARSVDKSEDVLESRASITDDVVRALADDGVSVVGVYGLGGVGKTKILEDVKKRVEKAKMFGVVVMVDVSHKKSKVILGEIVSELGLPLRNDEPPPATANRVLHRLERDPSEKILIILDNLWKELKLKEVGIPSTDDNRVKGCKLLLSSRYRHVLLSNMGAEQHFLLKSLVDEEAQRLFKRTVGDKVNFPEFKPLIDGVVKLCGGLPGLIMLLANRLRHEDVAAWKNPLTSIEQLALRSWVEPNYRDLKVERIRSLFLMCALASGSIPLRNSLFYCMGLGLFGREPGCGTIEKAREMLITDLQSLQNYSLLLDSDDKEWFKMHDQFVDAAISIASRDWKALVGGKDRGFNQWSKEELKKCTAISFNFVGIDAIPEKLGCPNLRMLFLREEKSFEEKSLLKIPPSFFKSMKNLQVLNLTGLSFESLPSSIEFLGILKSLCLDFCNLEDVTILGKLERLQFLSFSQSTIEKLPEEIGRLKALRFLDLTGCTRLKVIEPDVLGSLVNLEELYMENSFHHWEAEDQASRTNASLAELKKMDKLNTLHISIPHFGNLSRDLPFEKLKKHKIQIGNVWDWSGDYKESKTLKIKLDSGVLHEEWVHRCLRMTEVLYLDGWQDSDHNLCIEGFLELKHLQIQNSPSLHYVVHSNGLAFTRLESLFLQNLNNLEKICRSYVAFESFLKLKLVKVDNCGEILHLFPSSMMRIFLQLEEIQISRCRLIQQIVEDAEADEDVIELTASGDVEILSLTKLTLSDLPSLGRICSKNPSKVWRFQNLRTVKVQNCGKLRFLFSSSMVKALGQIEELEIVNCELMEEIMNVQEEKSEEVATTLEFPRLTSLSLEELPNLITFFEGKCRIHCPSLKRLKISRCPKMLSFSSFDGKQQSLKADWGLQQALSDINSGLSLPIYFFNQDVIFPKLEELRVEKCSSLRNLFTISVVESLGRLQYLGLDGCGGMEYIVAKEEEKSELVDIIVLPQLVTLHLHKMPKLRSFCRKHISLWPSLKELIVEDCEDVEVIVGDAGCGKLENRVPRKQPLLLVEKIEFPNMELMKISHMKNVEKIWFGELGSNAFGQLKTLIVEYCEKLLSLFSSHAILQRFHNLEKLSVTDCISLEVVFPVQDFNFSKAHSTSTFQLRELYLKWLPKMKHVWSGHPQGALTFSYLRCMEAFKCNGLESLFPSSIATSMIHLEKLVVRYCGVEEIIVEEDREVGTSAGFHFFPELTTMILADLPGLRSFSRNSHTLTWPLLKQLQVENCGKMRPVSFACEIQSSQGATTSQNQPVLFCFEKVIPRLGHIEVTTKDVKLMQRQGEDHLRELILDYSSFKEIFLEEAFGHGGATTCGEITEMKNPLKTLGNLKRLKLIRLGNPSLVWKGSLMAEILKQIEVMVVRSCPNLSFVFPPSTAFQSLTELQVEGCTGLVHMGTCSAVTSLGHLTRLTLKNCGAMEDVVTDDGSGVAEISFPKLELLELDCLPSLENFSSTNCTFSFPSLVRVFVMECLKIDTFCKGALSTPQLHKVLLSTKDNEGRWEGDLNTTIRTLST